MLSTLQVMLSENHVEGYYDVQFHERGGLLIFFDPDAVCLWSGPRDKKLQVPPLTYVLKPFTQQAGHW